MTFSIIDEDQEFAILEAFIVNNITVVNAMSLPPEIDNLLGKGSWDILSDLSNKGLLFTPPSGSMEFDITNAGKHKYYILKHKRRNKKIKNVIAGSTFILAAISALYGVLTYYRPDTNNQKPQVIQKETKQPLTTQPQTKTTDTIEVHHKGS